MALPLFIRVASAPDPRNVLLARLASIAGRPHLATWILEGADVEALKQKAIDEIKASAFGDTVLGETLIHAASCIQPEYFRTIDWLVTQARNRPSMSTADLYQTVVFANKYLGPVLMGLKAKGKPWPQLKAKDFTWDAANQFVMENAIYLGDNSYGPYYEEDRPVFEIGEGWRIVELPGGNVQTEGEEMNNCLNDNDEYHWTDKTLGEFISVLSLRDPLNRPHVSASVRYDQWNKVPPNLVYTEGPLLKNNRPLSENEDYENMWSAFEHSIQKAGGTITRGIDDWEEEEEEAEPYYNDQYDTTEYGDYLSVEDLSDLMTRWRNAQSGCQDWGQGEAERHEDEDEDGDPYYYYKTYGGREVGSDDFGLEQAVQDWMDDVEVSAGTDTPLDMEPQDFVGAVVLWATVLQDASGSDSATLLRQLAGELSQRAATPSDEEATDEARGMLAWAARELISDRSMEALQEQQVPYADEPQVRVISTNFAPVEWPQEGWAAMAPAAIHPQQLQVAPQPRSQPLQQQPPQVQGDPAGFRPLTEEERIHATTIVGAEWENNQTPENLNTLASWLMSTYPHTSPEEASRLLAAVTGQQVGYRQGRVAAEDESGWYEGCYPPKTAGEVAEMPNAKCPKCGAPIVTYPDIGYQECSRSGAGCDWDSDSKPQKTAKDEWDEVFEKKPGPVNIDPRKPYPFIYSPSEKWIKWGSENGGHGEIENNLARQGGRVPSDAYFGRWYPDNNEVYIYDAPFKEQPWRYQQAVISLIQMNAPH